MTVAELFVAVDGAHRPAFLDAKLPNDYSLALSCVNEGKTLWQLAPNSALARGVTDLEQRMLRWCGVDDPDAGGPRSFHPFEEAEPGLSAMLDAYPDSVMFASDYPHGDGVFPGATAELIETDALNEEQRQRVLFGNARRFYAI